MACPSPFHEPETSNQHSSMGNVNLYALLYKEMEAQHFEKQNHEVLMYLFDRRLCNNFVRH